MPGLSPRRAGGRLKLVFRQRSTWPVRVASKSKKAHEGMEFPHGLWALGRWPLINSFCCPPRAGPRPAPHAPGPHVPAMGASGASSGTTTARRHRRHFNSTPPGTSLANRFPHTQRSSSAAPVPSPRPARPACFAGLGRDDSSEEPIACRHPPA
jgi:hypothetical protein